MRGTSQFIESRRKTPGLYAMGIEGALPAGRERYLHMEICPHGWIAASAILVLVH